MNCIELKNVAKRFGSVTALKDVSVKFEKGKIYGLLGRNGAGKTTMLNVVTSRIFADSGEVTVDGSNAVDSDIAMGKIYMMGEKSLYPENMKIRDAFKWTKEFYPEFDLDYAGKLSDLFELNSGKKVKALSTGYGTVFKNIVALASNADYILLDEPVLGLDANHRDMFYKSLIAKYAEKQNTFVVSTHLIEEVSEVIENVVIIKNGEIIFDNTRDNLLACGYSALGNAAQIDRFVSDKKVIGSESLGGLKKVYIWGTVDMDSITDDVEISSVDLQKLFIQLTNS
jgi:ABC-2 type transport system ATP-binding protein